MEAGFIVDTHLFQQSLNPLSEQSIQLHLFVVVLEGHLDRIDKLSLVL